MQIPLIIYTLALKYSEELADTVTTINHVKKLGYHFEHIVVLGSKLASFEARGLLDKGCKLFEVEPNGIYTSLKSAVNQCDPQCYVWVINPGDKPNELNFSIIADQMVNGVDGIKGITACYLNHTYQYSFPKSLQQLNTRYYFHHQALIVRAHYYQDIDFEKFQISGDKYFYQKFEETNPIIFRTDTILATMNLGGVSQNGSRELTKFIEDTKIDISSYNFSVKRILMRAVKTFIKYFTFLLLGQGATTHMMKFFMKKL